MKGGVTHLDHAKNAPCPVCDPAFVRLLAPSRQRLLAETGRSVHTRPKGVEPTKLTIIWRKHEH